LKVAFDEFEYLDKDISIVRFKNVVNRWLKTKRSRLKSMFLGRKIYCLMNIKENYWDKLKVCSNSEYVEQMSNVSGECKT
jgi:hypothetical protein